MTSAEYLARAVVISTYPFVQGRGEAMLGPAGEQDQQAVERFKRSMAAVAPAGADPETWAAGKVYDLFAAVTKAIGTGDIWCSRLPSSAGALTGEPLLVLNKANLEQRNVTVEECVRQVHLNQVVEALDRGLAVPPAVIAECRHSMKALQSQRATA